ncbi:hypothetical protein [Paenibacillus hexagrammi]|uniref:ATP-grasp domain-containing protein n=1 Tax=Paenibacillus hexagrammi TaxID=2908839 RepID=A0ABY3SRD2_9BACL|nr:hypothetical protein [Paenibacillus sp. YPD9-1]UJF35532.1 hypothetical protein L0M14_10770 [Paenibacillus sp. YPD9-1]
MSKRSILFCGNGYSGEILETLAKEYDLYLISSFRNDRGMEHVKKIILANPLDPQSALQAAKSLKEQGCTFDAVLSLCMDTALSVSAIAEHYQLFGVPYQIAQNATIKSIRSRIFETHDVSAPKYRSCCDYADYVKKVQEIGFPYVIKPLNLFASRASAWLNRRSK